MSKTWILVAHRGGARLFENRGPGKGLEFLQNIDNPAGKLKSQEINSDKAGRSSDRGGRGRHAYATEQDPTVHIAEHFAKRLATLLEEGRTEQRYRRLVLVAEPRFLGLLRSSLPDTTAGLVSATLDKDLGGTETRDLPRHLEEVVYV
jgi:protein required for attachment to host cells